MARQSKAPMRQVLISHLSGGRGELGEYRLEVLRHGHKGPRRVWRITGDGALLAKTYFEYSRIGDATHFQNMLFDWLMDNPETVLGCTAQDVYDAVAAVRRWGWSTTMPKNVVQLAGVA